MKESRKEYLGRSGGTEGEGEMLLYYNLKNENKHPPRYIHAHHGTMFKHPLYYGSGAKC